MKKVFDGSAMIEIPDYTSLKNICRCILSAALAFSYTLLSPGSPFIIKGDIAYQELDNRKEKTSGWVSCPGTKKTVGISIDSAPKLF
jgi:hypothetical protein